MMRTSEEYRVWHGSQEAARRGRGTRWHIYKLRSRKQLARAGRRVSTIVVILDFRAAAFTSTIPRALHPTFDTYGVPQQDAALMKRMQSGSWYAVANSLGETAACVLENGMKHFDARNRGETWLRIRSCGIALGWCRGLWESSKGSAREGWRDSERRGACPPCTVRAVASVSALWGSRLPDGAQSVDYRNHESDLAMSRDTWRGCAFDD